MSWDPKDPDVTATYAFNWEEVLVDEPVRGASFATGAVVRPQRHTGFYYECTTAGKTKAAYPAWPRIAGETVKDGSVIWTTRHPDSATVRTVQSAVWTVPSGVTLVQQIETAMETRAVLSGGVDGQDYLLTCRMTPSSGTPVEQSATLQVRQQ